MDRYPSSMLRYIEQSVGRVDSSQMREFIRQVVASGRMDTIDWDHLPVPPPQEVLRPRKKSPTPVLRSFSRAPKSNVRADLAQTQTCISAETSNSAPAIRHNKEETTSSHIEPRVKTSSPQTSRTKSKSSERDSVPVNYTNGPKDSLKRQADVPVTAAEKRAARAARFAAPTTPKKIYADNLIHGAVIGSSTDLFKPYYRLTGQVAPENVRPQRVLEETLRQLNERFSRDNNYDFMGEQLKSIRQDLRVQGIENEFTIRIYQINARAALAHGDYAEFKACITSAKDLIANNHSGLVKYAGETYALNLLSFLTSRRWQDVSLAQREIIIDYPELVNDKSVQEALELASAVVRGNSRDVLRLAARSPSLVCKLVEDLVRQFRIENLTSLLLLRKSVPINAAAEACELQIPDLVKWLSTQGINVKEAALKRSEHLSLLQAALKS